MNLFYWHEHRHVKDPNASDLQKWQSLPQVRLWVTEKPFSGPTIDVINDWPLAETSVCRNYQTQLPPLRCQQPKSAPPPHRALEPGLANSLPPSDVYYKLATSLVFQLYTRNLPPCSVVYKCIINTLFPRCFRFMSFLILAFLYVCPSFLHSPQSGFRFLFLELRSDWPKFISSFFFRINSKNFLVGKKWLVCTWDFSSMLYSFRLWIILTGRKRQFLKNIWVINFLPYCFPQLLTSGPVPWI